MKKILFLIVATLSCAALVASDAHTAAGKPSPEQALNLLLEGNRRFVAEKPLNPNNNAARRALAAAKNQGDYAIATVLGCSDSRAPIELIFDAGIMDLFVIRVPGNVFQIDEIGGAEYGIHHVNTPVMMVLGHSDCGAVTATVALVSRKMQHKLERNIPSLLRPIAPVVRQAMKEHPELQGKELIDYCIRENVYREIKNLFLSSASAREAVKDGKVKIVGALYDIKSGKVDLLDQTRVDKLLREAEHDFDRETEEYSD